MNMRTVMIALLAAAGVAAGGYGGYRLGISRNMQTNAGEAAAPAAGAASNAATTAKKILYWHDPMVPGQKFDRPGKSPYMDMDLVPVYAEGGGDVAQVTISPRMQQNLGVRTAEVVTGTLTQKLEAAGSIAYNERDVAVVMARVNGFVERLYVRAPLDPVRKGQPLVEIYVPDWIAAQEEYLAVRRMQGQGTDALLTAARQRMLLAGMNEEQVRSIEAGAKVQPRFTLTAPLGGVIAELGAREGMTVAAGTLMFRINGLGSVWVYAEIPESRAALVRVGAGVETRTPAWPGQVFKGRVAAILPEVNPATRTLKARIEVANAGGRLTPGMFASVDFTPSAQGAVLVVPAESVIQTGERRLVIVQLEDGKFQPTEVETGAEAGGQIEIRKGLAAGQKVVISSQFLIDSEANLKGATARMTAGPAPQAQSYRGDAKVESIGKDAVTLSHGPIPALGWGAMTMDFKVPAGGMPKDVRKGDSVTFEFRMSGDGPAELTAVTRMAPGATGSGK